MKTYCELCQCWYDENNLKTTPPDHVTDASTNADVPGTVLIDTGVPKRAIRPKKKLEDGF